MYIWEWKIFNPLNCKKGIFNLGAKPPILELLTGAVSHKMSISLLYLTTSNTFNRVFIRKQSN